MKTNSYDAVGTLVVIGLTVLFVFPAIMFALDYSTVEAVADSAKCAGKAWVAGYRNESVRDLFVTLLRNLAVALMFMILLRAKWRTGTLALYHRTVLKFGSIQITTGMLMVYGGLIFCVGSFASATWLSWIHYRTVADYCLQAGAL